jgi:hypothetical protein
MAEMIKPKETVVYFKVSQNLPETEENREIYWKQAVPSRVLNRVRIDVIQTLQLYQPVSAVIQTHCRRIKPLGCYSDTLQLYQPVWAVIQTHCSCINPFGLLFRHTAVVSTRLGCYSDTLPLYQPVWAVIQTHCRRIKPLGCYSNSSHSFRSEVGYFEDYFVLFSRSDHSKYFNTSFVLTDDLISRAWIWTFSPSWLPCVPQMLGVRALPMLCAITMCVIIIIISDTV